MMVVGDISGDVVGRRGRFVRDPMRRASRTYSGQQPGALLDFADAQISRVASLGTSCRTRAPLSCVPPFFLFFSSSISPLSISLSLSFSLSFHSARPPTRSCVVHSSLPPCFSAPVLPSYVRGISRDSLPFTRPLSSRLAAVRGEIKRVRERERERERHPFCASPVGYPRPGHVHR